MDKQKLVKVVSVVTGIMVIGCIIYFIINEDWFNESTEEAIVAFALRFLASNLNDEEVVEYLKDSLA